MSSAFHPTSYRLNLQQAAQDAYELPLLILNKKKPHESHPSLPHLTLLVFEAVLEVVCVSLPGYIVARLGHFDADKQKFLANLNTMLFTPCLIFTKLASQLNADKLLELGIIPVIFVLQTFISWLVAILVARAFGFNSRATNFVTAMGVFGNSNSLPISLVLSLSQTLKGLHWDKIPGDNDDEVGARGILYLLVFQQLGQLVRWSWGFHVLLAPKDKYPEYQADVVENGSVEEERISGLLIPGLDTRESHLERSSSGSDLDQYEPAGRTPVAAASRASPADSEDESEDDPFIPKKSHKTLPTPLNGNHLGADVVDDILSFPRIHSVGDPESPTGLRGFRVRTGRAITRKVTSTKSRLTSSSRRLYGKLPQPVQAALAAIWRQLLKLNSFLWDFMNPPLWAMLFAVVVASVPDLQRAFFQEGSFVNNSVTNAIKSSGGVAVPLILVVLGANLARRTQGRDGNQDPEEEEIGKKLLIASLISRMVLPTLLMAPILAFMAKYVPISILDDPIFVIVCFLLTGAPSALQLAQICQLNSVYEGVMSNILFQSYVIWILPSTLVLVMCALEVVEWAR